MACTNLTRKQASLGKYENAIVWAAGATGQIKVSLMQEDENNDKSSVNHERA